MSKYNESNAVITYKITDWLNKTTMNDECCGTWQKEMAEK